MNFAAYKKTGSIALIENLHNVTYDDAYKMVEDYISNAGGWESNDPMDAFGDGLPTNKTDVQGMVKDIIDIKKQNTYVYKTSITMETDIIITKEFTQGEEEEIREKMKSIVADNIKTIFPNLKINTIKKGSIRKGSSISKAERVTFDEEIKSKSDKGLSSFLSHVRSTHGLDDTWNISDVLNNNDDMIVNVVKYTDLSYANESKHTHYFYVVVNQKNNSIQYGGIKTIDN